MKKALVTGVTGQDGAYLAKFLLEKGYKVYGTYRRLSTPNFWRMQYLDILDKITLIAADLVDAASLSEAVIAAEPDEVYHLAAQSFVGTSFEQPIGTGEMTGLGVARILEVIRELNPRIRFYQASTSELFGTGKTEMQTEQTPFTPSSPYAVAKLYGYWITKIYREGYGIFASNGILFNHESPIRGLEFVTRKVTNTAVKISLGLASELQLGNLDAKRDWGYAPEYVESMWLMLQAGQPDDYIVATGETHTVRELVETAFECVGLDWKKYVKTNDKYLRPIDVNYLQGDHAKVTEKLGWQPRIKFNELVRLMVQEDLQRWQGWMKGERFAWDAPNYPEEINVLARRMNV